MIMLSPKAKSVVMKYLLCVLTGIPIYMGGLAMEEYVGFLDWRYLAGVAATCVMAMIWTSKSLEPKS